VFRRQFGGQSVCPGVPDIRSLARARAGLNEFWTNTTSFPRVFGPSHNLNPFVDSSAQQLEGGVTNAYEVEEYLKSRGVSNMNGILWGCRLQMIASIEANLLTHTYNLLQQTKRLPRTWLPHCRIQTLVSCSRHGKSVRSNT
jgi:hypothetical protein